MTRNQQFDPETIEELPGYTVQDIVLMYEDYDRMAKENEMLHRVEGRGATEFDKRCHSVFAANGNGCRKLREI